MFRVYCRWRQLCTTSVRTSTVVPRFVSNVRLLPMKRADRRSEEPGRHEASTVFHLAQKCGQCFGFGAVGFCVAILLVAVYPDDGGCWMP